MKRSSITVFVADDAVESGGYDKSKLDSAVLSKSASGLLKVLVSRITGKQSRGKSVSGYQLKSDLCLVVEALDEESEVNDVLASEIGTIGAVREDDEDDETESGKDVTLRYVANHQGMRLTYNKAIRTLFMLPPTGRVSREAILAEYKLACQWLISKNRIADLTSLTPEQAVSEWKASQKA